MAWRHEESLCLCDAAPREELASCALPARVGWLPTHREAPSIAILTRHTTRQKVSLGDMDDNHPKRGEVGRTSGRAGRMFRAKLRCVVEELLCPTTRLRQYIESYSGTFEIEPPLPVVQPESRPPAMSQTPDSSYWEREGGKKKRRRNAG